MRFKYDKFWYEDLKTIDFNEIAHLVCIVENYVRKYTRKSADYPRYNQNLPEQVMRDILKNEILSGEINDKNALRLAHLAQWLGLQGSYKYVNAMSVIGRVLDDMIREGFVG